MTSLPPAGPVPPGTMATVGPAPGCGPSRARERYRPGQRGPTVSVRPASGPPRASRRRATGAVEPVAVPDVSDPDIGECTGANRAGRFSAAVTTPPGSLGWAGGARTPSTTPTIVTRLPGTAPIAGISHS